MSEFWRTCSIGLRGNTMSGRQAFWVYKIKPVAFTTKPTLILTLTDPDDGYPNPNDPHDGP